ncbi:BTB/POZ domain-containing protein 17 [Papilio xuthus]|uniref:BTB/POZ domain-containing protein 17 n=1 Tax=Papilio xuthus TaxID=66420 RepID=A0A194Q1P1_PAPXU|nr:BTB/POZ domain-containing protein 17 [Papilio xuthus]
MDSLSRDLASCSSNSAKSDENINNNDDLEVDNSRCVLLKIATLYAEQLMSDLILDVDGVAYPVHRLILCASSEVFQVMLMNREWSECKKTRIVLQENPVAASVFPQFLKYFYTGQIKISHKTVLPVLSLADKYNVSDLMTLCLEYMGQHVAQAAQRGQLIAWMQYTMACGHNKVAKACQNFFKWNLEWSWLDSDLDELEGETLAQLLQQNDLVVHNEMSVYKFVERWLNRQRESCNMPEGVERTPSDCTTNTSDSSGYSESRMQWDALVAAAFSHVRFPMMCPNQLATLLLSPLTQQHKDFFMERMAVAMSYQSGQYERVWEVQQTAGGRALFTPRLYTEDMWGSVLAVDNFHSLPCYHMRTFIFSTRPAVADVAYTDRMMEWTVELYPKGVWFRKSMLIAWSGTYDVPEAVLRTVRIAITCLSVTAPDTYLPEPDVRVKIGILVWGRQNGVAHISDVAVRVHRFSAQNRVLNIDDALDFDELNTPLYTPAQPASPGNKQGRCPKCVESNTSTEPSHLMGPNKDQLRVQVVILPLTDYCYVSPAEVAVGSDRLGP